MRNINLADYDEPGLYLEISNEQQHRVVLTRRVIEEKAEEWLRTPALLPDSVRAATDYTPCDICPERDNAEVCHAILTALPFINDVDRYMSYDHVIAVYRASHESGLLVHQTTMQEALRFVAILSLTHYCEVGRKYEAYFEGVNPFMSQVEIANIVFRNMYLAYEGHIEKLRKALDTMQHELLTTTRCQIKRLKLISERDALLNAFVATEVTTELMLIQLDRMVKAMNEPSHETDLTAPVTSGAE